MGKLEHRSFRLPSKLLSELRRVAGRRQTSQTALAQQYLREGLQMDDYPLIVFRDGAVGRRPMLEGTRLDVAQIVETVRNEDGLVERAADYLNLSVTQVRACVRYYAGNRDEVDAYVSRVADENERLREAWEREQQLLAR